MHRSGFPSLGTVDIRGWILLWGGGCPAHRGIFSSIPGLHPVGSKDTLPSAVTAKSLDTARCLLRDKISSVEHPWRRCQVQSPKAMVKSEIPPAPLDPLSPEALTATGSLGTFPPTFSANTHVQVCVCVCVHVCVLSLFYPPQIVTSALCFFHLKCLENHPVWGQRASSFFRQPVSSSIIDSNC